MRPINLIPPDERRGSQAPLRSGPLAYILVGALVLVLVGVTALVLTGNKVSEREGEVATLTSEDATAAAEAEKLASYVTFQTTSEQRVATVQSLAGPRRRAVAAAVYLFLSNMISMGLGPLLVGFISDELQSTLGNDALRYSLLILCSGASCWAALHLFLASRTVRQDIAAATLGPGS